MTEKSLRTEHQVLSNLRYDTQEQTVQAIEQYIRFSHDNRVTLSLVHESGLCLDFYVTDQNRNEIEQFMKSVCAAEYQSRHTTTETL